MSDAAHEQMEGIVAGTPSLAKYDSIIDAGDPSAACGDNIADYDLSLPDGKMLSEHLHKRELKTA